MKKNNVQTFKIIRKNGRPIMTQVSNKKRPFAIFDIPATVLLFLGESFGRLREFLNGTYGRTYVALASGRMRRAGIRR